MYFVHRHAMIQTNFILHAKISELETSYFLPIFVGIRFSVSGNLFEKIVKIPNYMCDYHYDINSSKTIIGQVCIIIGIRLDES